LRRGTAVLLAACLGAGLAAPASANPGQIKVLVGFPPGAGTDAAARIYADGLREVLGATVVVENRTGAGGQIAAQALKAADPSTNTIMFTVDHQVVILPHITKTAGFDVERDMVPVGRIVTYNVCLAVHPSVPASDVAGYAKAARDKPALGSFGIPAPASNAQFMGFVIGKHFNVNLNPVPYRGAGPALTDLMAGQIPAAIAPCDAMNEYRKAGKIKVIGIASNQRSPAMPDVPTFAEAGVKVPSDYFLAVYAPSTMKPETVKQIAEATRKMFTLPKIVERLNGTGMQATYAPPEELKQIVHDSSRFWGEQIKQSGFEPN
jgi:tripartite-type tricarboxylate transporter receptor subunit TctC